MYPSSFTSSMNFGSVIDVGILSNPITSIISLRISELDLGDETPDDFASSNALATINSAGTYVIYKRFSLMTMVENS